MDTEDEKQLFKHCLPFEPVQNAHAVCFVKTFVATGAANVHSVYMQLASYTNAALRNNDTNVRYTWASFEEALKSF